MNIIQSFYLLLLGSTASGALFAAEQTAAPPKQMKVAFAVSEGANVIDLAGAWEVFQDTTVRDEPAFELFAVSEKTAPLAMTGGLRLVPNYTFADAPHPDIVVVGAQTGSTALTEWLRARAGDSRVVMSVCTGAFKLANAGLLDGKKATTHHDFWDSFAKQFPRVQLERGSRFVQGSDVIYTAGGLTSGIDLALHIVENFTDAKQPTAPPPIWSIAAERCRNRLYTS